MVTEKVVAAVAVNLCLDERTLVEVLALLLVLIDPQIGEHLSNFVGHKPTEQGVAGILRGCGQNTGVEVFLDVEDIPNLGSQHAPLVIAEVIDDDEEHLLVTVK